VRGNLNRAVFIVPFDWRIGGIEEVEQDGAVWSRHALNDQTIADVAEIWEVASAALQ
jgi:hypothetical protein